MENSSAYKWVVILFFSVVGIIFIVSVFYLAAGNVDPDTYWGRKMTLPTSNAHPPSPSSDRVVLKLDQGRRIGNQIFFYRGCRDDQLQLDVIIPEIDPEYSYPFRIDLKDAKTGFGITDMRFRLITLRPGFVSLRIIP